MELMTGNSMLMMEKSMDYLWTKQAAILDNIANVETPNYKPKVVSFEERFKEQLERARKAQSPGRAVRRVLEGAEVSVTEQQVSARMDDNGVNLTQQSSEMIRNAYQLQYVMSAINSDFSALRTAIQG